MCDGMSFVFQRFPRNIKQLWGKYTKGLSEKEMRSLTLYAKSHIDQHGFVNNIPVPSILKEKDLAFVRNQLRSGDKDSVKLDFYND